jgi:hypothetical protein
MSIIASVEAHKKFNELLTDLLETCDSYGIDRTEHKCEMIMMLGAITDYEKNHYCGECGLETDRCICSEKECCCDNCSCCN